MIYGSPEKADFKEIITGVSMAVLWGIPNRSHTNFCQV